MSSPRTAGNLGQGAAGGVLAAPANQPTDVLPALAPGTEERLLAVFHQAAQRVPAYREILHEAGVRADQVNSLADFLARVPVSDKQMTFGRFAVAQLCKDGQVGQLAGVLTSSGHSGRFAFGLYDAASAGAEMERIDAALDQLFQVRTRPTLLINCLPMGVKVYTSTCTVGETSVRADMVTALVRGFGSQYRQLILVGEVAFIKHVLELGRSQGVNWRDLLVHVVVGEEPLAENARKYLQGLLGIDPDRPETGLIYSSMGVAELGLNLFYETPALVRLRRRLHEDGQLRRLLGPEATWVPMVFTYDPRRMFVEVLADGRLAVTMLDQDRLLPLVRYATGDYVKWFNLPGNALCPLAAHRDALAAAGLDAGLPADQPVLFVMGRGQYVLAGKTPVGPEQVKEGLYAVPALAALTTCNFRLRSEGKFAEVRLQLAPGVRAEPALADRFREQIARYTQAPLKITCQEYARFGGGAAMDYERKFDYLEG